MSHTKEPWCFGSFHRLLIVPMTGSGPDKHNVIADLGETEVPWNKTEDSAERYDNAARIVACVNACAGISNTDLHALAGTSILEKANTSFDAVQKQRDELLAAVELAKPVMEAHAGPTRLADFNAAVKGCAE